MSDYDVIVIGAGHAGIEASLVNARLGLKTLVITQTIESIGRISCNPAVGGLAKGNIVREIDALGGQMSHLADGASLQYRILNESRGGAAQSPRMQIDKHLYSRLARASFDNEKNLSIIQETVIDLLLGSNGEVRGVVLQRGRTISCRAIVICSGTFMEGRILIGKNQFPCGRIGEPAALGLGQKLREKGLSVGRLSTSTSARVRFRSLDTSKMELQDGDRPQQKFTFYKDNEILDRPTRPCYLVYTNEEVHKIVRDNADKTPILTDLTPGPRYCPSFEEKVINFPHHTRHHIYIEPESDETDDAYLNGLYSGLPEDLQEEFLRKIPGFENIEITKPGYAVEYDYVDAREHHYTLESKKIPGLYFAGQVNGSSGYEEAAGQGFLAGLNAALKLKGQKPLVLDRSEAYLGVLVDDLVSKGTKEPYRMFSSRAEYRMRLRHDSADRRLMKYGIELGLHSNERVDYFNDKMSKIDAVVELLRQRKYAGKKIYDQLQNPSFSFETAKNEVVELNSLPDNWQKTLYMDIRYSGYVAIESEQVEKFKRQESTLIPENIDYDSIPNVSAETKTKLSIAKPSNLGQASRIPGIRPNDIAILHMYIRQQNKVS